MCKMNIVPWRAAREAGIGMNGSLQPRNLWAVSRVGGAGRGQIKMNVAAYSEIRAEVELPLFRR